MSILVFGSINMDLTTYVPHLPVPGETLLGHSFMTVPGGKGANQAVAVARLGAAIKLVGRIGDDSFGREIALALRAEGIDTAHMDIDTQNPTGLAVISVDDAAENTIIVIPGANSALDRTDVQRCTRLLDKAKILLMQLEIPVDVSMAVAAAAKKRGVTVILDPAPASNIPMAFYPLIDYITPNETETRALTGIWPSTTEEAERAAAELLKRGAKNVIIKMGSRGLYYSDGTNADPVKPYPVIAVDTVAAGDAFNGGLAVALGEGCSLLEAVRWGAAAGALAVTQAGAMPSMPYREDVEHLMKNAGTKSVTGF